jgi:hypothetical protein
MQFLSRISARPKIMSGLIQMKILNRFTDFAIHRSHLRAALSSNGHPAHIGGNPEASGQLL